MKNHKNTARVFFATGITLATMILSSASVSAHRSPDSCSGSGLSINLYTTVPQVSIGDSIAYSVDVFNGLNTGPTVCDATDITASLTTPDGVIHPISLTRTSLSNGQLDTYPNVVSYTAAAADVKSGVLAATAIDAGVIHQNNTDSQGGGNQGLNVLVKAAPTTGTLHVIKLVINANGGTAVASAFTLHVKNAGTDVIGSPAAGAAAPGTSYTLSAGAYAVGEDPNSAYVASFSGDCDATGNITLASGDNKSCTITNTDIAPPTPPVTNTGGGGPPWTPPPVVTQTAAVITAIPVVPVAPVVQIVPSLPSTGFAPKDAAFSEDWEFILLVSSLLLFGTIAIFARIRNV